MTARTIGCLLMLLILPRPIYAEDSNIQGRAVAPGTASGPARLELYDDHWTAATVNHISASAGFPGADPSAKIVAALASPLCSNGCIVDDGMATGSAALVTQDSVPIVVGAHQVLVLHAHHSWKGIKLGSPAIQLSGIGAAVVCEQPPGYTDQTASAWQGNCGIDLYGAAGGQAAISVNASGTLIKYLTVRGDSSMPSPIIANAAASSIDYVQIVGNVIRGTYSSNYTSSFGIDFTTTGSFGTMDHDVFADNVIYWTSGGIRFNPYNSAFNPVFLRNWYFAGYGPGFVIGPGFTFDAKLDGNACGFNGVSTADEAFYSLRYAASFQFVNNHDECWNVSQVKGVRELYLSNSSGTIASNTFDGNTNASPYNTSAYDDAYNIYIDNTPTPNGGIKIDTNWLKYASVSAIHFGTAVSNVQYEGNTYAHGSGPSGVYTDGELMPIYAAPETGPATGGPTGWTDTCANCASGGAGTANKLWLVGRYLPAVSFSQICTDITAADPSSNSDLCLYNGAGTLVADTGAHRLGSTGVQCFTPVQPTSIILPPGLYFYGWTSAGSTLKVNFDATSTKEPLAYSLSGAYGASAGGACPVSIKPPAKSVTAVGTQFGLF